jgi:hypothetical protein
MGGLGAQTLTKSTSYPGIEKQEIPSHVSNLYFLLLKPSKYMLLLISCILNHY